jgi:hypothetical protein
MKQNKPTNKSAKRNLPETNSPETDNRWVDQFFALFNQTMANK